MRLLVEELLDQALPVCIVDPKGDWWGLKLATDGKHPGFPVVIFGGEHADVPLNEHAGAHVAELFATGNRPCLIDLGGWMVGPRTRFWIEFSSTLFKHTRGQRWLVVDEIHNFAPKGKVFDHEAGKALHWTNRLASEGLGKGVSMLFASQRPQKVHNDTLTSAETLIAMRVLHPSDRGAVSDWIKGCGDSEGSEVLNSLANMDRGEGWVWSPENKFGPKRVKFPLFQTYDSFRPQTVADSKRLTGWAAVDLEEVRQKLAAVVQKAKSDDPHELRKQIAELKKQLATANSRDELVDRLRYQRAVEIKDEQLTLTEKVFAELRANAARARVAFDALVAPLQKIPITPTTTAVDRPSPHARRVAPASAQATSSRPARVVSPPSNGDLSNGEHRILNTLAMLVDRGIPVSRESLARWMAIHPNGGRFNRELAQLRANGYLDGLTLTGRGLGQHQVLKTGVDAAYAALPDETKRRVLQVIVSADRPLSREELAERLHIHPNGGRFNRDLAWLRTMGVIPERGAISATPGLFK
jgi:hypothetical protein